MGLKLGFGLPAAGAWATPPNLERVARQAEALGYHSLWVFFDPNFEAGGPSLGAVLARMESLAPRQ